MIKNIKGFVNEHQTLIIVIIVVLTVCFIYWFICCKEKKVLNKIEGGEVMCKIFTINGRDYKTLGMEIGSVDYPLFVLNKGGENLVLVFKKYFDSYLWLDYYYARGANSMNNIIKNPISYICNYIESKENKRIKKGDGRTLKRAFNGVENAYKMRGVAEKAIYSTAIRWRFIY